MKKNNKKGFTLVELVIVIAVMAALVAVAIPTVKSVTTSATNAVNDSNAKTIESMLKLAEAEVAKSKDGYGTLDEDAVATALAEAKLGIDKGSFAYDLSSGSVTAGGAESTSATLFDITFGAGNVTVTGTEEVAKPLSVAATATTTP